MRNILSRTGAAIALVLAASFPATADDDLVARGAYLVDTVMACGNCHTPMGPNGPDLGRHLSGGLHFDTPYFTVTASNLTSHETGLGTWSDDEIKRAIATGHRPDGSALAPIMPTSFYHVLTPRDLDAVVAYLRTVPPVDNAVPVPRYEGPPPPAFPGAESPILEDEQDADPLRKGFYLVTIAHCMECHTKINEGGGRGTMGAGGMELPGPWGVAVSANITSHPEAGIGEWSDEEIIRAITTGVSRDERPLSPPMGYRYYAGIAPDDLAAMVAYLRTVPAADAP
ncbi:c-type cytochrome [Acuticoccus sp. I52.16.1]|uniref:c-type cytochrome n=1 Tax=Acuticoccus sp. I52.16.1 TaxID=2928472 RepID=UPI001FD610CD|nr:c-type cytochrome [Acuticoccus sp. I52.16.1]UOM35895.1 cytochrome c [Acuticoccus sp. I52.16.1]